MSLRFCRNMKDVRDIKALGLKNLMQNDFVSDEKNVYVYNQGKLDLITGSGGMQGNVAQLYFDNSSSGVQAFSIVNGDVSNSANNSYYYLLQIVLGDGTRFSTVYTYDEQTDRSIARLTLNDTQIAGRKILACQVEKITFGDPYLNEIIAYEPLQQADYNTKNVNDPSYIKNKPISIIGMNFHQEEAILLLSGNTVGLYSFSLLGGEESAGFYEPSTNITRYNVSINQTIVEEVVVQLLDKDKNNVFDWYSNNPDYSIEVNYNSTYIKNKPVFDICNWYHDEDGRDYYIYSVAGNTEHIQLLLDPDTINYYSGSYNGNTCMTEYHIPTSEISKTAQVLAEDLTVLMNVTLPS